MNMKVIVVIDIINNLNVLGIFTDITDCGSVLGADLTEVLKDIYKAIQIAVPVLVILLCSVDIAKAVVAQEDKDMQAAISKSIKRVIIGLVIFFVPLVIDVLLDLVGLASGTCGIGG